ncbi:MAG: hypothetical protein J5773_03280 [Verrucomicrobia bacterium]|nr:hypothetical protein [Verrucomicrobiota bacterium]
MKLREYITFLWEKEKGSIFSEENLTAELKDGTLDTDELSPKMVSNLLDEKAKDWHKVYNIFDSINTGYLTHIEPTHKQQVAAIFTICVLSQVEKYTEYPISLFTLLQVIGKLAEQLNDESSISLEDIGNGKLFSSIMTKTTNNECIIDEEDLWFMMKYIFNETK